MKVVIPQDITAAGKDYLLERGYELVIGSGKTDIESMKEQVKDADAILARTAPYPAEVLEAAAAAPKPEEMDWEDIMKIFDK